MYTNYDISDSILQEVIILIKEIANEMKLPIIDVNTPLKELPECFIDGVHPTIAGEDTIANIIYRFINQASYNKIKPYTKKTQIINSNYYNIIGRTTNYKSKICIFKNKLIIKR